MPMNYGALGLADTDYVFNQTAGQRGLYELTTQYVANYNAEMMAMENAFVERTTEDFKERYYLPGGGRLQRRGRQAQPAAVKAGGSWDVGYPLEDFAAQIAMDDVTRGYMTAQAFARHVDSVLIQDRNTRSFEIRRQLLNFNTRTFKDENRGDISVKPLANGDSDLYPPVIGSEDSATENHYLESGYAASGISDINNPYTTIGNELQEHFGQVQGGGNNVFFINTAQVPLTSALLNFYETPINAVSYGGNADLTTTIPNVPGKIIGRVPEGWISEWLHMPANYIIGLALDQPKPLVKRIDPAGTGLGNGDLQMVAIDQEFPFTEWFWRARYGYGVGNRLNGVVMELGTGGTYTVPSGYEW